MTHSAENDVPQDWLTIDARRFGKFDANGAVMYECPLCDYVTGPHRDGSRLANEAKRNHMRDKHGHVLPPADMCHNGHPFEPGRTVDDLPGESHPDWCNVCGEARPIPPEGD